jgi:transcriptional regulator with XRE-family HTH domain
MTITPLQCRAARALADMTAQQLATASGVSVNTVTKFERGKDARVSTVTALQVALETAGVEFIADAAASAGGGVGLRLRDLAPAPHRSGGKMGLGLSLGM